MAKRDPKSSDTQNLLLFPEPGNLTLAEDSASAQPTKTLGVQSPNVTNINTRLDAQTPKTGRPQPEFDSTDEPRYPSRMKRDRPNVRIERRLLEAVKDECFNARPKLKLQDVTEDGYRLWLRARAASRVDAQTPTGSSSRGSFLTSDQKEIDLTTTTTTVDAQTPSTVLLPTFAADILNLVPHKSRYSLDLNLAYAIDQHNQGLGVKNPGMWAEGPRGNYFTGKFDSFIERWLEEKQREDAQRRQRQASEEEKQMREHLRVSCRRCNGTCMEVIPGKGARPCDHKPKDAEA